MPCHSRARSRSPSPPALSVAVCLQLWALCGLAGLCGCRTQWSFKQDRMELAYGCWGGSHKYLAYDNIERLEMTKPGGCCKCCAAGQVTFYTNKKSHLSGGLSMRTKQAKKVARMVVPGITAQALRHRTPAASRSPSPPPSARVNSVAPVAL